MRNFNMKDIKLAIVGLGYVGLPLAVEFGARRPVIGYDIDHKRINSLKKNIDITQETSKKELKNSIHLKFTSNIEDIKLCNIFIVTVPTPINKDKSPDLNSLIESSKSIGKILKKQDIVIYESTVYPGATEEICVPILESQSGLKFNKDFYVGYSPERINPGDKVHRVVNIKKVTSGSTPEVAQKVDLLYREIVIAGTHKATNIKVAEAAKVIENTQRDVNIALINELSMIFNKLDIDTESVLKAAATKWNFLNFKPGLVGGHCIGVDPYYLTHKSIKIGYIPEIILAGRRINDNMGSYVANQVIKLMAKKGIKILNSNVLLMGFTFKENCPDIRNTRVIDLVNEFNELNCQIDIFDPLANKDEAKNQYNIELIDNPQEAYYDAIILTVAHDFFKEFSVEKIRSFGKSKHILYDVKYLLKPTESDGRL